VRDYNWLWHMENAEKLQQAGNPARCIVDLETAMFWRPDYAAAYYYRAAIRDKDARPRLAIADLTHAIDRLRKRVDSLAGVSYAPERQWLATSLKRRAAIYEAIHDLDKAKQDSEDAEKVHARSGSSPRLPDSGVWGTPPAAPMAPAPAPPRAPAL